MTEKSDLLESVAKAIQTYQFAAKPQSMPDHVDRWLSQFTPAEQLPFLREFNHVIKQTFLTKTFISSFLEGLLTNEQLVGKDAKSFWRDANLLSIQQNGNSQNEMLKLLDKHLRAVHSLKLEECGSKTGAYIYVDDVIFTGGRISTDLIPWIKERAPKAAMLHVIVAASHRLGDYFLEQALTKAAKESGKTIQIRYWCTALKIENRKRYRNDAGVLWPATIPNVPDVRTYIANSGKYPLEPRIAGGRLSPFSSEAGRSVLEQEFLIAGVKIRSRSENPSPVNRPLGHGHFGVGFGALLTTYRNCPNNCPLALWWGDPNATTGPLQWYPLLPRIGY